MKLLLTSNGLANASIRKSLRGLVGSDDPHVSMAFITTAANPVIGDKSWLERDIENCKQAGYSVDLVDISSESRDDWEPRMRNAQVLCFGGGFTFYLDDWMKKAGLVELLSDLLRDRVYMGSSAGSQVAGARMTKRDASLLMRDEHEDTDDEFGLGLAHFCIQPHLNNPEFIGRNPDIASKIAYEIRQMIYLIDDESAVEVDEGKITVISEGEWHRCPD